MLDTDSIRRRLASGALPRYRVEHAARLGYEPARAALGSAAPPVLPLDLAAIRFWAPSSAWKEWKRLLEHLGPRATAGAAAAVAERIVGPARPPGARGEMLHAAIRALRDWVGCPCDPHRAGLEKARRDLRRAQEGVPEGPAARDVRLSVSVVSDALDVPRARERGFTTSFRRVLWWAAERLGLESVRALLEKHLAADLLGDAPIAAPRDRSRRESPPEAPAPGSSSGPAGRP